MSLRRSPLLERPRPAGEPTGRNFDIQKFSLHDGPGIRTVVFLKGCVLACLWCSNPGSRKLSVLKVRDPEDASVFVEDSRDYTVEEVVRVCLQDLPFYEESGGGVTLSGGEALVQFHFSQALLRALRDKGIHTAIETTGIAAPEIFAETLDLLDLLIIDVKHHDKAQHKRWTGRGNALALANLDVAVASGIPMIARIPVIPGVNDGLCDAAAFAALLREHAVERVQLLPFHQFGERKYDLLGWDYTFAEVPPLHEDELGEYAGVFREAGVDAYF
ncbi:MAG: glycyl-radical enzyme activating protein [Tetrasphaera sp.]